MIRINDIHIENGTIRYDYTVSKQLQRYFNAKNPFFVEYDADVTSVPKSIAVVPLLANLMPIAWFVGFDIEVDEVDATFYESLTQLKAEFSVHFNDIRQDASLKVKQLVDNTIPGDETALLFSGGLDAFEALTRNIEKNPFLVSVFGADIDLSDTSRWEEFKRFNEEEPIVRQDRLCYVKSNLRTFYTSHVDFLVDVNWWGKIQHGMALISLIAPLSFVKGIKTIRIASSNTGEVNFGWGSTSETDEKVKWADSSVIHDGFQFRRTEKIENIVAFANRTGEKVKLRVCYHDLRTGYNCSECAKCQRTMLGFILDGANPNEYGFTVPPHFYKLIHKNFGSNALMTTGVAYEWKCLQDKAKSGKKPFIISDESAERAAIEAFSKIPVDKVINRNADKKMAVRRMKYAIITKFPKLFNVYLRIRRKL